MNPLTDKDIVKIRKIGSSMRGVLREYNKMGASIYLAHYDSDKGEAYFDVEMEGVCIPLLAKNLNFYSTFNSLLAQKFTSNKWLTYQICKKSSVPVPYTAMYDKETDLKSLLSKYGTLVVKPLNGSHGDGITTDVETYEQLRKSIDLAHGYSDSVLIQQMVDGDDYRLLFLDYKLVSVVKRKPPFIIGDGKSTVSQLIGVINAKRLDFREGLRGNIYDDNDMMGSISGIPIDEVTDFNGSEFMEHVPSEGREIQLLNKANVSLGGQAKVVDVRSDADFIQSLENLLLSLDLPICGVDVMSTELVDGIFNDENTHVIEFNAAPGFRLHEFPYSGESFPVSYTVANQVLKRHKKLQKIGL